MKKITIYTNETCPYCVQVKENLTKEKLKFKEKDIVKAEKEWREIVSLTGLPTVPTILYDEEYLVAGRDFQNPQQLVSVLQNFKSSSHDDARKTLERMKTLNFHISSAFMRIDQLLRQIDTNTKKELKNREKNVDKSTS